jgi:hypothetical protein
MLIILFVCYWLIESVSAGKCRGTMFDALPRMKMGRRYKGRRYTGGYAAERNLGFDPPVIQV